MKIYSKFKDYYDVVQSYDIDDDIVYRRSRKCVDISSLKYLNTKRFHLHVPNLNKNLCRNINIKSFDWGIVGIAGRCHLFFKILYHPKTFPLENPLERPKLVDASIFSNGRWIIEKQLVLPPPKQAIFYFQDEIDDFFLHKISKRSLKNWHDAYSYDCLKKMFATNSLLFNEMCTVLEKIFINEKVPVFSLAEETQITLNPHLYELEFQRKVEPFTCYQDIRWYLGGVLGMPERSLTVISDEIRAQQHGFDKNSFRTMKGDKKPRKSNRGKTSS